MICRWDAMPVGRRRRNAAKGSCITLCNINHKSCKLNQWTKTRIQRGILRPTSSKRCRCRLDGSQNVGSMGGIVGSMGAIMGSMGAVVGSMGSVVGSMEAIMGLMGAAIGSMEANVGSMGAIVGSMEAVIDSRG